MTTCDLQTELTAGDGYLHRCRRDGCGRSFVSTAPRHQVLCRIQPENDPSTNPHPTNPSSVAPPSLLRQAASFASAEVRWIAAGRPVRGEERVAEIFAICQACPNFRPGTSELEGSCSVCGCRLRSAAGLFNKIQMATESCPLKPPRWGAEEAPAVNV